MKKLIKTFTFLSLCFYAIIANAQTLLLYQLRGIDEPLKTNAQKWLITEQKHMGEPLTPEKIRTLFEKGPEDIKNALAPYGYFQPSISGHLSQSAQNTWTATYTIQPGPPLKIHSVNIQIIGPGADLISFRKYRANFPITPGHTFNAETYNEQKKKLNMLATEVGFLDAKFTLSQVVVDLQKYQADINLTFDTGPQFYFGQVHFSPNPMDDAFLRRFLQFQPGDPYSPDKLMELQQHLSSTRYFNSVSVEPVQDTTDNNVPVEVNLKPSKSQLYSAGVGYGTDTGIRGTLGWDLNHITPTGQTFESYLQASQIQSSLNAQYNIPGKNPLTEQYFIGASVSQQSPNTSEGHTQKVTFGKSDMWGNWQSTLSLNEQFDQYNLRGGPIQHSHLLLPNLTLLKMKADNPIFPRSGQTYSINVRGASQDLLSSTSFLQAEFAPKFIFSPSTHSRVVMRGDFGWTATSDIEQVPLSLQFFAGGSDSVRGYQYQELGPGKYLIVGSTEYQYEVKKNWFGAAFVDAGNAINSFANPKKSVVGEKQPHINLSQLLKVSAGVGVVWVSPVGPMEITLAKPITDSDKKPMIQFTMGSNL